MPKPRQPVAKHSAAVPATTTASAAVYRPGRRPNPKTDRQSIAKEWQVEAYRHVNICGEARYAVTLFAAMAARAELGISLPQALMRKAVWVNKGPEVDLLSEIAPTARERSKLIRDYMTHYVIAGESYLIARERVDTDPGYIGPPDGYEGTWEQYRAENMGAADLLDPDFDASAFENPNTPIWEIVAVTEIRRIGERWEVRHDNGNYLTLADDDPVIRMWNPDPENRREAWSPFRSMLPTLREIEWFTRSIFAQVRSRLMSAGVWFLPNNLTFKPPPPEVLGEDGEAKLAAMNEAEQFMLSLADSSMESLGSDEVPFPTIVTADPDALQAVDSNKLIDFWSGINDKLVELRADSIRRFALGMDLPPEQVLGSSGIAVTDSGGSAGSVNHWGVWANEEQTISAHIEPGLDIFVGTLTNALLRSLLPESDKVIAYDTASLRLRQDRSAEAAEWYDRGVLKAKVALRETGFDPENDMMDNSEHRKWLLNRVAGGSATPEQVQAALVLLGVTLPPVPPPPDDQAGRADVNAEPAPAISDRTLPPSLDDHPYEGPPREDHEHHPAPFSSREAAAEVLILRALEKAGNRLLNDGKRGKDKDRTTPAHLAHVGRGVKDVPAFDFSLAPTVYSDLTAEQLADKEYQLKNICAELYRTGTPYTRERLMEDFGE